MATEKIPFMDLEAQLQALEPEWRKAVEKVIASRSFIQGPALERFNKNFLEAHCGAASVAYGTGCDNGTSAITVALRALDLKPGDEVLIPNHTFIATAEAVVEMGATPVLVEINEKFHQMDLSYAAAKITAQTKAIIAVHLYGLPEPMDQILMFAHRHNLKVIEDCAQAHLAKWNGQAVGTFGDIGTFSFYPGKNLGAFGDAGFILTRHAHLFDFIKRYIDHGRSDKYRHEFFGGNVRMDGLQAAVLDVKLTRLPAWTERRRELAKAFDEQLIPKGFRVLTPQAGATPVYHLYVVEMSNRDVVMAHFQQQGIGCGIHYPISLNAQPAFAPLGYLRGQFPVSERMCDRILSFPFFPEMTVHQMQFTLQEFFKVARP